MNASSKTDRSQEVAALAAEIAALPPPAKLRLAATLLEQRRAELAHSLIEQVALELGAALAVGARR